MNKTLLNLFHDNHNGSGKAGQHLLIKVTPSHTTSAKGGVIPPPRTPLVRIPRNNVLPLLPPPQWVER